MKLNRIKMYSSYEDFFSGKGAYKEDLELLFKKSKLLSNTRSLNFFQRLALVNARELVWCLQ